MSIQLITDIAMAAVAFLSLWMWRLENGFRRNWQKRHGIERSRAKVAQSDVVYWHGRATALAEQIGYLQRAETYRLARRNLRDRTLAAKRRAREVK